MVLYQVLIVLEATKIFRIGIPIFRRRDLRDGGSFELLFTEQLEERTCRSLSFLQVRELLRAPFRKIYIRVFITRIKYLFI